MKYLVMLIVLLLSLSSQQVLAELPTNPEDRPALTMEELRILKQVHKNSPKLDLEYAVKVSQAIVKSSHKYHINSKLIAAILMQESGYKLDAARITCGFDVKAPKIKRCVVTDYGIAQIHFKNLARFKLDKQRLLTDLEYSVDAGVMIMSQYAKYRKYEPDTWTCRYNTGTAPLHQIQEGCTIYLAYINRWF